MVKKLHQKTKRYLPRAKRKPRGDRLKSFKSEEAAKKWAESNGIKDYSVKRLQFGLSKKCVVIEK